MKASYESLGLKTVGVVLWVVGSIWIVRRSQVIWEMARQDIGVRERAMWMISAAFVLLVFGLGKAWGGAQKGKGKEEKVETEGNLVKGIIFTVLMLVAWVLAERYVGVR